MMMNNDYLDSFISNALKEDIGDGDHTSFACIPENTLGKAFHLNMISDTEKRMTDMIEKLTKENLSSYKITLEKITYQEETSNYSSDLKVSLR